MEKIHFHLHRFTPLKGSRNDLAHRRGGTLFLFTGRTGIARGEGIYKKVGLLILDEWLLTPLKDSQAMDVLEIVETRHQNASTIFCTQFAPGGWHEKIGEETLADAILDRIVHDSYTIFIDGRVSMRGRHGVKQT
jgi:hypothetical protein